MVDVSQDILRAFVREALVHALQEDAVVPRAAAARGLALMTPGGDATGDYVLYDQDVTVRTMLELPGEPIRAIVPALVASHAIVGALYIVHDARCGARVVNTIAAEKGFGPLLYEAAMADGPLAPSRDSVSFSAERVWRRYHDRPDVTKTPLTGRCRQHVKVRPWLNFAYSVERKPDLSALLRRHEATLGELSYDFSAAEVSQALASAGSKYFDSRYVEA
jgi:hypothetical protein